jgi:hypothetical protein
MLMHLSASIVQNVSKMRLGDDQPSRGFSGFFWNLFSFSLRLFYLLEGFKILFMFSKYFICIFMS